MFWKGNPGIFLPFSLFHYSYRGRTRQYKTVTHLPVSLVVLKTVQELCKCYYSCFTLHLPKRLSEISLDLSCYRVNFSLFPLSPKKPKLHESIAKNYAIFGKEMTGEIIVH